MPCYPRAPPPAPPRPSHLHTAHNVQIATLRISAPRAPPHRPHFHTGRTFAPTAPSHRQLCSKFRAHVWEVCGCRCSGVAMWRCAGCSSAWSVKVRDKEICPGVGAFFVQILCMVKIPPKPGLFKFIEITVMYRF